MGVPNSVLLLSDLGIRSFAYKMHALDSVIAKIPTGSEVSHYCL